MAEPFLGEVRLFSFNFPPKGWALCNGQLLPINQNQALFALLGTMYGGNGQTTFALPNLRGRTPIHHGNGHTIGEQGGSTSVALNIQQLPTHTHTLYASGAAGNSLHPTNNVLAQRAAEPYRPPSLVAPQQGEIVSDELVTLSWEPWRESFFTEIGPGKASAGSLGAMHPGTVTSTGGSQPHNNMQPYLVLNFCIALQGLFPSTY